MLSPYTTELSLGMQIVESLHMVETVEDWSRVRSPARARRRRYKHRQNIRIVTVPRKDAISTDGGRTMFIHPETARVLRNELVKEMEQRIETFAMGGTPPAKPGVLTAASLRAGLYPSPWQQPMFKMADS